MEVGEDVADVAGREQDVSGAPDTRTAPGITGLLAAGSIQVRPGRSDLMPRALSVVAAAMTCSSVAPRPSEATFRPPRTTSTRSHSPRISASSRLVISAAPPASVKARSNAQMSPLAPTSTPRVGYRAAGRRAGGPATWPAPPSVGCRPIATAPGLRWNHVRRPVPRPRGPVASRLRSIEPSGSGPRATAVRVRTDDCRQDPRVLGSSGRSRCHTRHSPHANPSRGGRRTSSATTGIGRP